MTLSHILPEWSDWVNMVKELSHIFCPSAFDHTFGRHQEGGSFESTVELLLLLIICSVLFEVVGWNIFSVLFDNVQLEKGLLIEFVIFSYSKYLMFVPVLNVILFTLVFIFMHIASRICNRLL